MKLHVEIEVDDRDLDAVAFALGLTPKTGTERTFKGQVNAEHEIKARMRAEGITLITRSRHFLHIYKEMHHVPQAQQEVLAEAAGAEDRRQARGGLARA